MVHNKIISLHMHCPQMGPYFRDWVLIRTFLAFWVLIGSLSQSWGVPISFGDSAS